MQYLFMCRSLTSAQRASQVLGRSGITASVVKAPQKLRAGGCGYAVSIYRRAEECALLLRQNQLLNGKIFRKDGEEYTEVRL